ncbi:MAG: branched-chain amino acid aminotransferase [Myxococcales bacterium]|nr:branched-chain amino acid aminotransferase [Myxococcales bacterium]
MAQPLKSSDAVDPHRDAFVVRGPAKRTSKEQRDRQLADLGFGRVFSDHMVTLRWTAATGWTDGAVVPRAPLSLDPSACVLHYGQSIFEGYKAYAHEGGGIHSFRPFDHAKRFNRSAARLAMPALPESLFVEAADALVREDRDWVPRGAEQSFYLRPLLIGVEPGLGVRPSGEYLFLVIGSPSGAYFTNGVAPVTVWISREYVRASPGGTGAAKCAGNYAASLVAQAQAKEHGCDQVLWLDAIERRQVEELGGMNVFFVFRRNGRDVLVTPPLKSGSILPGVTRMSLFELAGRAGYAVAEEPIAIDDVLNGAEDGSLREAFACGTAAVITPIGNFKSAEGTWRVQAGTMGPIAAELRQKLLDIQYGRAPDPQGWLHKVV